MDILTITHKVVFVCSKTSVELVQQSLDMCISKATCITFLTSCVKILKTFCEGFHQMELCSWCFQPLPGCSISPHAAAKAGLFSPVDSSPESTTKDLLFVFGKQTMSFFFTMQKALKETVLPNCTYALFNFLLLVSGVVSKTCISI